MGCVPEIICRSVADEFDAKRRICPRGWWYQTPLKVRPMLFVHTDVFVRSRAVEMIVGARASTQSRQ